MTTEKPEETTVYHETVFYLEPQYYYLFLSIKKKNKKLCTSFLFETNQVLFSFKNYCVHERTNIKVLYMLITRCLRFLFLWNVPIIPPVYFLKKVSDGSFSKEIKAT